MNKYDDHNKNIVDIKNNNNNRDIIDITCDDNINYNIHINGHSKDIKIDHTLIFDTIKSNKKNIINIRLLPYLNLDSLILFCIEDSTKIYFNSCFINFNSLSINVQSFIKLINMLNFINDYTSIDIQLKKNKFKISIHDHFIYNIVNKVNINQVIECICDMIISPTYLYIYEDVYGLYNHAIDILYKIKCKNIRLDFSYEKFIFDKETLEKIIKDLNLYGLHIDNYFNNDIDLGELIIDSNITKLHINDIEMTYDMYDYIKNKCKKLSIFLNDNFIDDFKKYIMAVKDNKKIKYLKIELDDDQFISNECLEMLINHPSLEYIQLWSKNRFRPEFIYQNIYQNSKKQIPEILSSIIKNNRKCNTFKFGWLLDDYNVINLYNTYLNDIMIETTFALQNSYNIINYNIFGLPSGRLLDRIKRYLFRNKYHGVTFILLTNKHKLLPQLPKVIIQYMIKHFL